MRLVIFLVRWYCIYYDDGCCCAVQFHPILCFATQNKRKIVGRARTNLPSNWDYFVECRRHFMFLATSPPTLVMVCSFLVNVHRSFLINLAQNAISLRFTTLKRIAHFYVELNDGQSVNRRSTHEIKMFNAKKIQINFLIFCVIKIVSEFRDSFPTLCVCVCARNCNKRSDELIFHRPFCFLAEDGSQQCYASWNMF